MQVTSMAIVNVKVELEDIFVWFSSSQAEGACHITNQKRYM